MTAILPYVIFLYSSLCGPRDCYVQQAPSATVMLVHPDYRTSSAYPNQGRPVAVLQRCGSPNWPCRAR